MLTSRRPDTLHLYDFYSYWRTSVGNFSTLPQHLKAGGFETISVGKVFHPGVSSNNTDDYPLSWTARPFHSPAEAYSNKAVCTDIETGQLQRNAICPVVVPLQPLQTLPDIESVRYAKEILLNRTDGDRPLFLAVGLHKPHIPLRFPISYLDLHDVQKFDEPQFNYVPYDLPTVAFNPYTDIRHRSDVRALNISFPFGPMPHPYGMRLRQAYYAAVSYVDDLIGDLLSAVDLNETVVVLTGDHGWSLGEHAEWAKYSNFEVALRVPLIIHTPHTAGPARTTDDHPTYGRIENIVELVDVFPTIVELAGLPPLQNCTSINEECCVEGRSLVRLFRNSEPPNATVAFSQCPRPSNYPQADSDRPRLDQIKIMGYTMRTSEFRYTSWIGFDHKTFRRSECF